MSARWRLAPARPRMSFPDPLLNISKPQQRTLHALARGGRITLERDERRHIVEVECLTREGWRLGDCTLEVFLALKRRRLVASRDGGPYQITREGLLRLRPQGDNRTSDRGW
jgi:uncharacterized protein YjhX (UPF0386 family)